MNRGNSSGLLAGEAIPGSHVVADMTSSAASQGRNSGS